MKIQERLYQMPLYDWNKDNLTLLKMFKILSTKEVVIAGHLTQLNRKLFIQVCKVFILLKIQSNFFCN